MTLLHIIAGLLRLTSVAAGLFSFDVSPDPAHKLYLLAIPVLLVLVAAIYGLARLIGRRRSRADNASGSRPPRGAAQSGVRRSI